MTLPGGHDLAPGFFVAVARLGEGAGVPPVSDPWERCPSEVWVKIAGV